METFKNQNINFDIKKMRINLHIIKDAKLVSFFKKKKIDST